MLGTSLPGTGYAGVSVFFVLSGFVLAWSRKPGDTAARFYWHRFARVWPSHALVVVLMLAFGLGAGPLLGNLLLTSGWNPQALINPPSWSLTTEAVFYLLFPALLVLVTKCPRLAPLMALLIVGAVSGVWVADLLDEFVLGMAAAIALGRGWRPPRLAVALPAFAIAYLLEAPPPLLVPFTALLLASLANADQGGLRAPEWLVMLGRWSFAFYLVHWAVLHNLPGDGLAWVGVGFAMSTALAGALHCWFERPVERWLRRRGWQRAPRAVPASA